MIVARRQPAPARCAVKGQGEQADSDGDQCQAGEVDAPRHGVVRTLGDGQRANHQRHHRERHQQPEDRPPAQRLSQQAAHQRPRRVTQTRYAVGQPDRVAGAHRGEGVGQHADRHREDQGRTDSLQSAEGDHQRGRRRHGAQRRCQSEQRDAGQQRPPAAEDVADPAGRDHERTQRQHVDADHPLQIGGVAVEVRRHPRQRQIHREVVDLDAEQRGRYGRQDPPGTHGAVRRGHGPTIQLARRSRCSGFLTL